MLNFFEKLRENSGKLFLLLLCYFICATILKTITVALNFSFGNLLGLLTFVGVQITLLIFIKKDKINYAFFVLILNSALSLISSIININFSFFGVLAFLFAVGDFTVLLLLFIKRGTPKYLLFIILGITVYYLLKGTTGNLSSLFQILGMDLVNKTEAIISIIINIILNFLSVIFYLVVVSIATMPYSDNNITILKKASKYVIIVVSILVCIFIIHSCVDCVDNSGDGSSGGRCAYTYNGVPVCDRPATKGGFCNYHFNMLNDFKNDLEDWWNSLR